MKYAPLISAVMLMVTFAALWELQAADDARARAADWAAIARRRWELDQREQTVANNEAVVDVLRAFYWERQHRQERHELARLRFPKTLQERP